jgi:RimJ/RimL family protein N-acetyltransferase
MPAPFGNEAVMLLPERLGFQVLEVRRGDTRTASGAPRDTMVFGVTRSQWHKPETSNGRVR